MRNRFKNLLLQSAVLAMFVLSGSGLLPCLLGALAGLDGGHSVGLTRTAGTTVMVLGHVPETGSAVKFHDHSAMASMVIAFSEASAPGGDHVISFSQPTYARDFGVRQISPPDFVAISEPPLSQLNRSIPARFARPLSPAFAMAMSQSRSAVLRI